VAADPGVGANATAVTTGSANSSPVSYGLTGAGTRELAQYVGRRVEVVGTLDSSSSAAATRNGDSSRDGNAATGVDARRGDRGTSGADVRSTDTAGSTVGGGATAGATSGTTSSGTTARDAGAATTGTAATGTSGTTGTRSGSPGAVSIPGSTATAPDASHRVSVASVRPVSGACQ
jgi:hypothetical protein